MKDKPVANLIGANRANRNIFELLAIAHRVLQTNGQIEEAEDMVLEVKESAHNYNEALEVIGRYVEVVGYEYQ